MYDRFPPYVKSSSTSQFSSSSEPPYVPGIGDERGAESNERLIYQAALEDLNQPKLEANLPVGLLSVSLLRHQKIALAWMLQKETRSLHCLGGILADDQGLGKTISMIALIQHVGEALLPIPIKDEIMTVSDAIGTCVAWPKELVISEEMSQKPKQTNKRDFSERLGKGKNATCMEVMPKNLPLPLQTLCNYANSDMKDGVMIHTRLGPEVFGKTRFCAIGIEDIYQMANMEDISNNSIAMYMSYLHAQVEKSETRGKFVFVNPIGTPKDLKLKRETETERTRTLSTRLLQGQPGQVFLVPYNSGDHWELSVIMLDEGIVYHLDPSRMRLPVGELRTIVDNAIVIYNANVKNKSRKSITWKPLSGIPPQQGRGCGLWVMLYMNDIVKDKNLGFATKWEVRKGRKQQVYTATEIDAVRNEWANYVTSIQFVK